MFHRASNKPKPRPPARNKPPDLFPSLVGGKLYEISSLNHHIKKYKESMFQVVGL